MSESVLAQLPNTPVEFIEFILIGVLFRGVFSKWLGTKIVKYVLAPLVSWAGKRFVKTEREIAIWLHYRNRAMRLGHNHKNAVICEDGRCKII